MKSFYDGLGWWLAGVLIVVLGCGAAFVALTHSPTDDTATSVDNPSPATIENTPAGRDVTTPQSKTGEAKRASEPANLDRALALAQHSLETLENVKDYTGVFSKRELVSGSMVEERDKMKVRHRPFSVYLRVIEPTSSAGQEVIYVEGRNNGNLVAHTVGLGSNLIGRLNLDPDGIIAKRGNRYTIRDVGLKNLTKKLIDLGSRKGLFRDSTVKIEGGEFAERPCTDVKISSPRPVGAFRLATARIAIDREWDVPVLYEAYEWPADGGKPFLSETYSYFDLEFDVGLTDRDFDPDNSEYSFP